MERTHREPAVAVAILTLLCGCRPAQPTSIGDPGPPTVTILDYFQDGERRLARHLEAHPAWQAASATAATAVVRLRIHRELGGGARETHHGTAVLVAGGRQALTAAHVAVAAIEPPGSTIELVLGEGRALTARARGLPHYSPTDPTTDWAILDVVDPPAGLPWLPFAEPASGERLILGFPGRVNLDSAGRAVLDDASALEPGSPLRVLCRADRSDATELDLVAGAVPQGGMSGAPCVDRDGRLVALQRAVSESRTGSRIRWTIDIVGLEGIRRALGP